MSRQRAKGTAWESAVVAYLREHGWQHVERRAPHGSQDRGDIAGLPLVVECKNAQRIELAAWLDEANTEAARDGSPVGVVWIKRRGKTSPGAGYVVMDGDTLVHLMRKAGY